MSAVTEPSISVGVPARDEELTLPLLLDSLLAQTQSAAEILVADGGSTDGTVAVGRGYADRGVRMIEVGPAFPGRGRNEVIRAASHEWIALVDAGCVVDPGWLEALWEPVRDRPDEVRAVLGHYEPRLSSEWDVAQVLALVPPIDPKTGCRPPFIASSLVHRSAWEAAGRFPEDLRAAEDLLFFEGLKAAHVPTARAPKAVVRWSMAPSPAAVFRRLRLYSKHHFAAGLSHTWHRRVFAMDVVALVLLIGSIACPWLMVPLALGAIARLGRTVFARRTSVVSGAFRPDRLCRVAALLVLADVAAWAGLVDFLSVRGRRS